MSNKNLVLLGLLALLVPSMAIAEPHAEPGAEPAIPPEVAAEVERMRGVYQERGEIGLMLSEEGSEGEDPTYYGIYVAGVRPGGAAERAGFEEGDFIFRIDDRNLPETSPMKAHQAWSESLKIEQRARYGILRDGRFKEIILIADPPSPLAIEYWLVLFVRNRFGEEVLHAYEPFARARMKELATTRRD